MTKLFQTKEQSEKRCVAVHVRFTEAELQQVKRWAALSQMTTSSFIVKAALGEKIELRIDREIAFQLSDLCRTMRGFHKAMVGQGVPPPEEAWRPLMEQAIDAITVWKELL